MSYRRSSVRQPARHPSQRSTASQDEEAIENPNAFSTFGRFHHAPQAVYVSQHINDEAGHQGHAHEHRSSAIGESHQGWQTVEVHQQTDPSIQHAFPAPYQDTHHQLHRHLQEHDAVDGPNRNGYSDSHHTAQEIISQTRLDDNPETPLVMSAAKPAQSPAMSRHSTAEPSRSDAFIAVHGGNDEHIAAHGEQIPIRLGHLFKRPVIRQWVLQDKVYREVDDREPSQFELFFDLVMVGVIHVLAEAAAEAATGLNVAKFVLCFYPAWSIWSEVRSYINVSGTDDIWQRIYILIIMILLMGYTANAAGIVIEKVDSGVEATGHAVLLNGGHEKLGEDTAVAGNAESFLAGSGGSGLESHRRAWMAVASAAGSYLVRRSEGGGEDEQGPEAVLVRQIGHTGYWFASGWHAAIASAIGFYLVAKFLRLALYFIYGTLLPKFRKALWLNGFALFIISCVYLPIIFILRPGLIVILLCAGVLSEILARYAVAAALQIVHGRAKHRGHKTYMPAYSLPHMMERTTLFIILVIGEIVMNSIFTAFAGEYGPQVMFWRSALAIVIAFLLMWIYFDVDSSRTFVHGLKRHWFTSITYTNLHFPLSAALILMGSAMTKMIHQEAVEQAYLWFFSGSIGLAMFCMGVLGMLHKSLDRWGSTAFPRFTRISLRFIVAAVLTVMPILHHWKSLEFLGVNAAMLALVVAFETFGKLGAVGRTFDPVRAEELRRQRMGFGSQVMSEYGDIAMTKVNSEGGETLSRPMTMTATVTGARKKLNKDSMVKSPGRRASWHEYDDLTGAERGEEDVGIESELGKLEAKQLSSGERWAYVAI